MGRMTILGPEDILDDRSFTHPDRISYDLNTLRYMVDQLCLFFEHQWEPGRGQRPVIIHQPNREKWIYRLVIARPEALLSANELTIVGFLGHRLPDADREQANKFDTLLVGEIPEHPGLLSYSTMALVSGDFSNLVVFANNQMKERWSGGRAHAQAVDELAPNYYASVRLYNGQLPRGIMESNALNLTHIKYFDYRSNPCWRAIRVFQEA